MPERERGDIKTELLGAIEVKRAAELRIERRTAEIQQLSLENNRRKTSRDGEPSFKKGDQIWRKKGRGPRQYTKGTVIGYSKNGTKVAVDFPKIATSYIVPRNLELLLSKKNNKK